MAQIGSTPRRGFLASMAALAAATGLAPMLQGGRAAAVTAGAAPANTATDPALEAWFAKIKGKHRQVFDASEPNSGMGAIWPRVYLNTINATYPNEGATAVVILRHGGIPMAMHDALWSK